MRATQPTALIAAKLVAAQATLMRSNGRGLGRLLCTRRAGVTLEAAAEVTAAAAVREAILRNGPRRLKLGPLVAMLELLSYLTSA